jgi:FkbM family methyltransferase
MSVLRHWRRVLDIPAARKATSSWWQLTAAYAKFGNADVDLKLRSGLPLHLHGWDEVAVFWQIFARQCYEVRPTDRLIIDAGGNIGLFAVWATQNAPQARVISIEPNPDVFTRLQEAVRSAGVADRVDCVQTALGNDSTPRWLADAREGHSTESYIVSKNAAEKKGRMVACTTLPSLLESKNCSQIDLLKMDIESSEYEVLLATPVEVLRRIQRVNIEFHVPDAKAAREKQEVLKLFQAAGLHSTKTDATPNGYGVYFFERN